MEKGLEQTMKEIFDCIVTITQWIVLVFCLSGTLWCLSWVGDLSNRLGIAHICVLTLQENQSDLFLKIARLEEQVKQLSEKKVGASQ